MSAGQRCLYIVVLLINTTIGSGEGPSSPVSPGASTLKADGNELTVSFSPFEDIFRHVPEKYFETENNTKVTSQIGSTALIPCIIRNIGDGIISWIRRKDYHLLTVGLTTYSSDQRFQAIHLQHSEDWTLKVKFVQKRDEGIYECQVSSHPPTSIFLQLDVIANICTNNPPEYVRVLEKSILGTCFGNPLPTNGNLWIPNLNEFEIIVQTEGGCSILDYDPEYVIKIEARALISGPTEKYLKPGSALRLQCSVVQTTEAPAFVFWYHNNRMINYDIERGVNVTTDPEMRLSDLLIPVASVSHAGNYTCVPNNAVPASIYVHIFNGENPAAMQSSSPKYLQLSTITYICTLSTIFGIIR